MSINDAEFAEVISFVKKNRKGSLSEGEKLDILRLHAYYRYSTVLQSSIYHSLESIVRHGQVTGADRLVAKALGRRGQLVSEIWAEYLNKKAVTVARLPGNRPNSDSSGSDGESDESDARHHDYSDVE